MCQICATFNPYAPVCEYSDAVAPAVVTGIDGAGTTASAATAAQGSTIVEDSDADAGAGTAYAMGNGDFFFGTIEDSLASDWIEVTLQAGMTYTFAMVRNGALSDGLNDPLLRLRDTAGREVATDDDGGPGRTSSMTFTAGSSGTYYVDAQSWSASTGGDYVVSMVEGTVASFNAAMGAGALIRNNVSWSSTPSTPVTVTWGVRESGPARDASGTTAPFVQLSVAQVAATQTALSFFDGVSGLQFSRVNPGGTTDNATILVGAYQGPNDGAGAYAYYPGSTASTSLAGDIWLDNDSVSTTSLNFGSYSFFTVLHEIGHAVGLAHPGDYNAAPGTSITYDGSAQFIQDTHQFTVMSYFDERYTTTSLRSYPDTLMLYDIYALHQLYGTDYSYNSADTVYGFNATAIGSAYDFASNSRPLLSIWDGGGTDTLDLSGFDQDQVISLIDGTFSDVGGFVGNLSIAFGAVIENAVGGSGDDAITGNAVGNTIDGGRGADSILGGGGGDWLLGADGNDTLRGENGNDTLDGGIREDALLGGAGNDRLLGGGGFDLLRGGIGDDWLHGGDQSDNLYGEAGQDTLYGGNGLDRLFGGADNDLVYGGADGDGLFGGFGDDTLHGEDGADRFFAQHGNDVIYGGADNDTIYAGADFDHIEGGGGDDELWGQFNADTFVFGNGHGTDTIMDFDARNPFERIDLSGLSSLSSIGQALAASATVTGGVLMDTGNGNSIFLSGVAMGDLDASDFIF